MPRGGLSRVPEEPIPDLLEGLVQRDLGGIPGESFHFGDVGNPAGHVLKTGFVGFFVGHPIDEVNLATP